MRYVVIIPIIALVGVVVGTIGFDYFNEYVEERDIENFVVSCMKQYGHNSDELVNCLNNNSFSNP